MKKLIIAACLMMPIVAQAKSDPDECGKTLGCVIVQEWDPFHGYREILMVPKDPADYPKRHPMQVIEPVNKMVPQPGVVQTDTTSPLAQGLKRLREEQGRH